METRQILDEEIKTATHGRILLCSLSRSLGGVELRMALEAGLLLQAGYSPRIAINLHPPLVDWAAAMARENIPVFDFDPPPFMEDAWRWRHMNKLQAKYLSARFLRQQKLDLVHVFIPWTGWGGTRLWLAHYCRLPTVISVRNAFPRQSQSWSPWHARHYREAFRSVRGVYAISASALEHFLDVFGEFLLPETVVEVIHNGVDTGRFRPTPEARTAARDWLGLPQEALVLGSVGRLHKQKQPWVLVSVFSELKRMFPTLYLVLVGTGPLEHELRRQVEALGVSGSVIFVGFHAEVEKVLPAFDLFAMLSSIEGFGTVTVEALASGLPVVGTDVPGTRDILKNGTGGVLVPLGDQRATVDVCARLLRDSTLRTQLGKAAREEAVRQYDQPIWEARILAFYEKVLHGAHNPGPAMRHSRKVR